MKPQSYGGVVRFDALLHAWLELKLREGMTEEDRAFGGVGGVWAPQDAEDLALCEELLAMLSMTVRMTGKAWDRLRALQVLESAPQVAPCRPEELMDLQTDVAMPAEAGTDAATENLEEELEPPSGVLRV